MKNFQRTINGQVYKGRVFEEEDILKKLGRNISDWELINKYQKTFPQLLLDDTDDFVIDARTLHTELGVGRDFTNWVKSNTKSLGSVENTDFIELTPLKAKTLKVGRSTKDYSFTIEVAKDIAMTTGTNPRANDMLKENSKLVRNYFTLVEKCLKDMDSWNEVREPEKKSYNEMSKEIDEWGTRNEIPNVDRFLQKRECNMINMALLNHKAIDIRSILKSKNNITRDNFTSEYNKIIDQLQQMVINQLLLDLPFSKREEQIKKICELRYKHIKEDFKKFL